MAASNFFLSNVTMGFAPSSQDISRQKTWYESRPLENTKQHIPSSGFVDVRK